MKTLATIIALSLSAQAYGDSLKAKTADISTRDLAQILGFPLLLKLEIQDVQPHQSLLVTLALWAKEHDGMKLLKKYPIQLSPNTKTVSVVASYHDHTFRLAVGGSIREFRADEFPALQQNFTSAMDANLTPEGYLLMDTVSEDGQKLRFTLQIEQNKS